MKPIKTISFFLYIFLSSLFFSTASIAVGNFDTNTGILVIPEVDADGTVFFDDVALQLNFTSGTFELIGFNTKPESISTKPIETQEDQNIKMEFLGCARSGRNEVTCHVKLTSLGGLDRNIEINTNAAGFNRIGTKLFDDLGNTYTSSEITSGNLQSTTLLNSTLIAGVPTLTTYKFENVLPSASSLSLFQPEYRIIKGNSLFSGDFRNIDF